MSPEKKPAERQPAYPLPPQTESELHPAQAPGRGGETHQVAVEGGPVLTTDEGTPVADDQNSLKAGDRGPTAMQDFALRQKIFHFDHERIPERVVHARGTGAHGVFESYGDISDLTCASVFKPGKQTEVFVRFSTVAGNKGSADLARDVRGFAVKMYTDEGNWDLVGNNIPVFFVQDAVKFPDFIHSVKEEQDRGFPQAASAHDTFWDFVSLVPETQHTLIWAMSGRGIPRSYRFMEGFGVHTYRFINEAGDSKFVKFHWKPLQGLQAVTWPEAVSVNGADPDFHRRDLWTALKTGDFPAWELGVQVFDDAMAEKLASEYGMDVLDATKLIPEEVVPVKPIGKMTLNRAVSNHFDETEQVAFQTNNIVKGIGFTNDPLLQGRNFSYLDTQLTRLGSTNFTHIPVNAPKCPMHTFQRDGHMQTLVHEGRANYEPNSWAGAERGPREDPTVGYQHFAQPVEGELRQLRAELFADHFSQPRMFWKSQTPVEQQQIVDAYVFELSKVETPNIRERQLGLLLNIDEGLAQRVADGIGMDLPAKADAAREPIDLDPSDKLSIEKNGPASFKGRKLGLLLSDGVALKEVAALVEAVNQVGGAVEIIAPTVGGVTLDDGAKQPAAQFIKGVKAGLYDAIALLGTEEGFAKLAKEPAAKDFVTEAHVNCKYIGAAAASKALLDAAGVQPDAGYVDPADAAAAAEAFGKLRYWERQA